MFLSMWQASKLPSEQKSSLTLCNALSMKNSYSFIKYPQRNKDTKMQAMCCKIKSITT